MGVGEGWRLAVVGGVRGEGSAGRRRSGLRRCHLGCSRLPLPLPLRRSAAAAGRPAAREEGRRVRREGRAGRQDPQAAPLCGGPPAVASLPRGAPTRRARRRVLARAGQSASAASGSDGRRVAPCVAPSSAAPPRRGRASAAPAPAATQADERVRRRCCCCCRCCCARRRCWGCRGQRAAHEPAARGPPARRAAPSSPACVGRALDWEWGQRSSTLRENWRKPPTAREENAFLHCYASGFATTS